MKRQLSGLGIILSACVFFTPAHAAPQQQVDPRLCQALVQYTPSADVAYQPGVDVQGKPVAPADLPGGSPAMAVPDKINIPLTMNMAKLLNLNTTGFPNSALGAGTEAQLGTITVEGNKVSFNGQALTSDQQDKLAVLCMRPNGR